jgi:hypothetical protein
MFMPRWVSRLLIEVTEVRVERVQSISYNDAMAEGVPPVPCLDEAIEPETLDRLARSAYEKIWASIHINDGHEWKKNPWVWAVTFKEIKA